MSVILQGAANGIETMCVVFFEVKHVLATSFTFGTQGSESFGINQFKIDSRFRTYWCYSQAVLRSTEKSMANDCSKIEQSVYVYVVSIFEKVISTDCSNVNAARQN